MKKLFKLAVSLLICGAILLSGCGTASTSLPSDLQPKAGQVSTINILDPNFFCEAFSEKTEKYKEDWLEEMSLRYGVKLNITSNTYYKDGKYDNSATRQIKDVLSGKAAFAGLVELQATQISSETIDQLLPLDDYLADNPVWKTLPDELKDAFKVDGHIYAIPANVFRAQNAREIYNEALKETGITVTDLQSFSNFAKAYTQSTGKAVLSSFYLENVTDILNAFGLYNMNYTVNTPFSYDPTADCCVDFLTKGAAVDALEYLRELYQAGALDIRFDNLVDYKDFNDGVICTVYGQYTDDENCTELLTLNPEYPQIALTVTDGFAMTKDTPQPKETINQYMNMLFGSEDSYLECWLGTSDNYVLNSDGTITVKMPKNADGSFVYPPMPNLTGGMTDIFPYSNANIFFSQNGVVGKGSKTEAGKCNDQIALMNDSFEKELIVDVPSFYQASILNNINTALNKDKYMLALYKTCIKDAITNPKRTVQQIVDKYREEMFNNGGNQMLDEVNAAIGKKTAYYYG